MIYAIGDVHGEITKLKKLVSIIAQQDKKPSLIFIGDYFDKGENSFATLEYLLELKARFQTTFLLGNHDFFWKFFQTDPQRHENFLNKYGGTKTQQDFKASSISELSLLLHERYHDFFSSLQLSWENESYLLTHSGLTPSSYRKSSAELSMDDVLFNRFEFLKNGQTFQGKRLVFGHTSFFAPFYDGFKIGIDTGACYAKSFPLTAYCLDKELFLNSNGEQLSLRELPQNIMPSVIHHQALKKVNGELK